ncbi:hypothetical protein ACS127_01740 [Amphibacillus sp. Q70]|uniref:hypothetical protein n=1 Tax=Amphibacillus sp. Q70 TaxID=3453416 RepID=UPI003F87F83D
MPLTQQSTEELLRQSEEGYLQFLKLFLEIQISSLQAIAYSPSPITDKKYAEKQLVESLALMDNILTHLYSRDILARHYINGDSYSYLKEEIEATEYLMLEFKLYLRKSQFEIPAYKEQCERLINQISKYFYKDYVKVIVINTELPKPWFASSQVQIH